MKNQAKRSTLKDTFWTLNGNKWVRKIPPTPPFEDLKKCVVFAGLHLHQQHQKRIDQFCEWLRQRGYNVMEIMLYPTRDPKTISAFQSHDTLHLCLKDLLFWGFPKKHIQERLQGFQPDLFINLNGDFSYSDMGFCMASLAPYRISSYHLEYKPYFNILLKRDSENDLEAYLQHIQELFSHLK